MSSGGLHTVMSVLGAGISLIATLVICDPARGQSAPENSAADGSEIAKLDTILVTARRREEDIREVPLSISAFTAESLNARGANSLADVSLLTPGLNFEAYPTGGYPVLTLRGLAPTTILGFEANVSTFWGGIYLPRAYMIDPGLTGISRIEVVKGPQSALYGRNAFAGAVNYEPVTAPDELTIDAHVTLGSDKRRDYGLSIGGPIVEDSLSAILGYTTSRFDGTWDNAHPNATADAGGTTGQMGGWDGDSYFASAMWTPTDALTVVANWSRVEREAENAGRYLLSRNAGDGNCSLVNGVLQFYCGELPNAETIVDPRSQGLNLESDILRLDTQYSISDRFRLNYLYGRFDATGFSFDQSSVDGINGDIPAGVLFLGIPVGEIDGDSHELRATFSVGTLDASIGLFYSDLTDDYATVLVFRPPLGLERLSPSSVPRIVAQNSLTGVETKAIFSQVSKSFIDDTFDLSLEARYSEETKTLLDRVTLGEFETEFTSFTPRFVAQWFFSPLANMYASAAKGVKSGGFNGGNILESERTFDLESNWTYELGTKAQLFEGTMQLNAALFYVDWSNLQTLSSSGNPSFIGTITRNVGSATSYGAEFDSSVQLTEQLQAFVAFAYANPTFGEGLVEPRYQLMRSAAGVPIVICDDVVCPADGSIGGNVLPRQSKVQASAGLNLTGQLPFAADIEYSVGGDLGYKSKQYLDPLLLTWVPARTLVNLNASVTYGAFQLRLFAKNVFDNKYVSSAAYLLAPTNNVRYEGVMGERRTIAATLRYRF